MGNRNPFRISVDAETGWLYWGEVGPDAGSDSAARGPRGYDEFNQARGAGNFGWPYVIADNKAVPRLRLRHAASGPAFNPAAPVNNSPNNTGADEPAAGAAGVDLVSVRRVDAVSRAGQRRAHHDGRAGLPLRPDAGLRHQAARRTTTTRCSSTTGRGTGSRR